MESLIFMSCIKVRIPKLHKRAECCMLERRNEGEMLFLVFIKSLYALEQTGPLRIENSYEFPIAGTCGEWREDILVIPFWRERADHLRSRWEKSRMLYGRAKESIKMLPAAFLQKIAISFLISQIAYLPFMHWPWAELLANRLWAPLVSML